MRRYLRSSALIMVMLFLTVMVRVLTSGPTWAADPIAISPLVWSVVAPPVVPLRASDARLHQISWGSSRRESRMTSERKRGMSRHGLIGTSTKATSQRMFRSPREVSVLPAPCLHRLVSCVQHRGLARGTCSQRPDPKVTPRHLAQHRAGPTVNQSPWIEPQSLTHPSPPTSLK
jgi:hypothetical protein